MHTQRWCSVAARAHALGNVVRYHNTEPNTNTNTTLHHTGAKVELVHEVDTRDGEGEDGAAEAFAEQANAGALAGTYQTRNTASPNEVSEWEKGENSTVSCPL